LDELDALMQRMLALPVDPPEDLANPPRQGPAVESVAEGMIAPAEAAPSADVPAPASAPEPGSSGQAEQATVEEDAAKNEVADPSPTAALVPVSSPRERMESWGYSSRSPSATVSNPFAGLDPPRTDEVKSAPSRVATKENARPRRVAWPLYPLLGINWAFDLATAWLGPLGRWLRGPRGRALLGWGGLLLLAATLAWLAYDTLGWTW